MGKRKKKKDREVYHHHHHQEAWVHPQEPYAQISPLKATMAEVLPDFLSFQILNFQLWKSQHKRPQFTAEALPEFSILKFLIVKISP